jgi:hypothetical protein
MGGSLQENILAILAEGYFESRAKNAHCLANYIGLSSRLDIKDNNFGIDYLINQTSAFSVMLYVTLFSYVRARGSWLV